MVSMSPHLVRKVRRREILTLLVIFVLIDGFIMFVIFITIAYSVFNVLFITLQIIVSKLMMC